jgi:hypothetical protein
MGPGKAKEDKRGVENKTRSDQREEPTTFTGRQDKPNTAEET